MNTIHINSHEAKLSPVRAWSVWAIPLAALWWLLVEGRPDGLWFALPVLALAFFVRRALPIPLSLRHIRPLVLAGFTPYFLWKSLLGGIDVAWRSLHPRLPLSPAMYTYPFRLRSEGARVFLAQVVSLMPGTLACRVGDRNLVVHALTGSRADLIAELSDLEHRTARIFGEHLEDDHA